MSGGTVTKYKTPAGQIALRQSGEGRALVAAARAWRVLQILGLGS